MRIISLVFLIVFILSGFTFHKFYVSTTSIKFIPDNRSLQITAQVFADDFEFALKKMASGIKLNPDNNADLVDSLTKKYFTFPKPGNKKKFFECDFKAFI